MRLRPTIAAVAAVGLAGVVSACELVAEDSGSSSESSRSAAISRVVDGDTIEIKRGGRLQIVRLIGIDTPETKAPGKPVECGGLEASKNLERAGSGSV